MRPLFRAFEAGRVRYLVIGGQAAILYGAAHFSQDLDLWIDPSDDNVRRFVDALGGMGARVHKLTPPLSRKHLSRGHGFHFVVPLSGGIVYVDVMGCPPRVDRFAAARRRAPILSTPWGALPVVSIPDLVELKKTNRPADYEVITRLAMIRAGQEARPSPRLLKWALDHLFRVEDVAEFLARFGGRLGRNLPPGMGWVRRWIAALRRGRRLTMAEMDRAARALGAKAGRLQARGRRYWIPRLEELRVLRAEGGLIPEGTPVSRAILEAGQVRCGSAATREGD